MSVVCVVCVVFLIMIVLLGLHELSLGLLLFALLLGLCALGFLCLVMLI